MTSCCKSLIIIYFLGIYQHVYGSSLGGHAIKLIGWGTENGVDYWIINNSWNTYWVRSLYVYVAFFLITLFT